MDIKTNALEHRYKINTPFERLALYDVNLSIPSGTFVAIIGHTGSGKSTILQHLNGLLKPTSGSITIGDQTISANKKEKHLKPLRKKVGVVFQFPEYQLFEETVEKDICFGPINFGASLEEAKKRAKESLKMVGLPEEYLVKSPFDLSGGQMRRVAIAGIIAMEPEVLVLDEPTAGLDPKGRHEIMEMFYHLHKERNLTTILVTHSMEDAAKYADFIVVMHKGTIAKQGTPEEIFSSPKSLVELGLNIPETVKFKLKFEDRFGVNLSSNCLTLEDVIAQIQSVFKVEQYDG